MNKEELKITQQDKLLLQEMKENCLKADVYDDEKRLLKANAITKFLYLPQENKELKEIIEEVREWLKYKAEALDKFDIPKRKETGAFWFSTRGEIDNLLQILDKVKGE